jgi:hypothetical protein
VVADLVCDQEQHAPPAAEQGAEPEQGEVVADLACDQGQHAPPAAEPEPEQGVEQGAEQEQGEVVAVQDAEQGAEQGEVVADLAYDQGQHAPPVVVRVLVDAPSQRTAAPTARQSEPQTQPQEAT